MDYKLQWQIQKHVRPFFSPSSSYVRLSPYPANGFTNPGCNNKLYDFYVPITLKQKNHVIKKQINNVSSTQEGKGLDETNKDTKVTEIVSESSKNIADSKPDDPIKHNENIEKKIGVDVQSNFLHPNIIKTGSLSFYDNVDDFKSDASENKNSISKKIEKNNFSKTLKHKFFVI